jgi:hypothetical protein
MASFGRLSGATSKPAELLRAGAALIESCGWYRGDYWPGHDVGYPYCDGDPVCALGALYVAADANPGYGFRYDDAVKSALAEQLGYAPNDHDGVAAWNDTPERSVREVIALLRAAADRLDRPRAAPEQAPVARAGGKHQPGGHIRQDTSAGLALPTNTSGHPQGSHDSEEIAMVEPAQIGPAAWGGQP